MGPTCVQFRIAVFYDLPSGGAKRTLYEQVRRLSERHTVDAYTLSTADENFCDLRPYANDYQVFAYGPSRLFHSPFGRLNQLQRWRDLLRLDRLGREIARRIDSERYDVVFAHPCMWSQAPTVLRHLRTPTVYYCQEPPRQLYPKVFVMRDTTQGVRAMLDRVDPLIALYRLTARRLDRDATRKADVVLVNSQYMRDAVAEIYGIQPCLCYHGIDTEVFAPRPEVERWGYVLSVGAIHPPKGFDFVIESLGLIPEPARPALRVVGNMAADAQYVRHLEALAAHCGVDVTLEVGVDQHTLVRRYNEASLLAYAPYNEPFGLVTLEAMACGTPVVGVAEGGVRETVVDGVTGVLTARDRRQFADAVAGLLADAEKRWVLGEAGVEYVRERWTWDAAVTRVESHLAAAAQRDVVVSDSWRTGRIGCKSAGE